MWCPHFTLFHCKVTIMAAKMTTKTLARKLEKTAEKITTKMVKGLRMIFMIATLDPKVWDM